MNIRILLMSLLFLSACGSTYDHLTCYDESGNIDFEIKTQKVWLTGDGTWNWTRADGVAIYRQAKGICELRHYWKEP